VRNLKRAFAAMFAAAMLTVVGVTVSASPAAAAWDCTPGYSCYFDGFNGSNKLFTAARCGEHDLRGGIYQNKINSVANYGSGTVYLDIWRNAGYWEQYDYVLVGEERNIFSNDIDRIVIIC